MDEFSQTFRVICNRSEREKKIQEIVILPRQEITLSVLYLTITFIYHVSSSSFQRQERNYIEKVGATYIIIYTQWRFWRWLNFFLIFSQFCLDLHCLDIFNFTFLRQFFLEASAGAGRRKPELLLPIYCYFRKMCQSAFW